MLDSLEGECSSLITSMGDVRFVVHGDRNHRIIKLHMLRHWKQVIQRYGAPSNFNGELWEKAHSHFVKHIMGRTGMRTEEQLVRKDALVNEHRAAQGKQNSRNKRARLRPAVLGEDKQWCLNHDEFARNILPNLTAVSTCT